jgi:hypothetical protein
MGFGKNMLPVCIALFPHILSLQKRLSPAFRLGVLVVLILSGMSLNRARLE